MIAVAHELRLAVDSKGDAFLLLSACGKGRSDREEPFRAAGADILRGDAAEEGEAFIVRRLGNDAEDVVDAVIGLVIIQLDYEPGVDYLGVELLVFGMNIMRSWTSWSTRSRRQRRLGSMRRTDSWSRFSVPVTVPSAAR